MATGVSDASDEILRYLDAAAKRKKVDLRQFSLDAISATTGIDSAAASKALTYLSENDYVTAYVAQSRVYIPDSADGERVKTHLAKTGFLGASQFAAVFLALCITYAFWYFLPPSDPEDLSEMTAREAYQTGYLESLVLFAVFGLILALAIHAGLVRLRRWRIVSSKTYQATMDLTKPAIVILLTLNLAYYLGARAFEWSPDPTVELGILTASVGGSLLYNRLRNGIHPKDA